MCKVTYITSSQHAKIVQLRKAGIVPAITTCVQEAVDRYLKEFLEFSEPNVIEKVETSRERITRTKPRCLANEVRLALFRELNYFNQQHLIKLLDKIDFNLLIGSDVFLMMNLAIKSLKELSPRDSRFLDVVHENVLEQLSRLVIGG